jgi:hypothetical protein
MARKHNATGRSLTKERFALVPLSVMNSAAYRCSSMAARSFLLEVASLYMGVNNGHLGLSAREAGKRMNCTKDTANRAANELLENGLLEVAYRGVFNSKLDTRSSEYRLTWFRCDKTNALPSKAFMQWKKPEREKATVIKFKTRGPVFKDSDMSVKAIRS